MPKERYRLYHAEKAKGGMALTMTAGSAIVVARQPGRLRQSARLSRRDRAVAARARRRLPRARLQGDDPAHPSRPPHRLEQGRLAAGAVGLAGARAGAPRLSEGRPRTGTSSASSPTTRAPPQRMQAAGLDGIEFEAYGHLMDGFWSPATNRRDDEYGGSLDNRLRFTWRVIDAVRAAVGPDFIVGIRMVADEDFEKGLSKDEGVEIARRLAASGKVRFPQHHPRLDRDRRGADQGHPDHRHALVAASRLRRRGEGGDEVPGLPRRAHRRRRDRAARDRHRQARHGRHDPRRTSPTRISCRR